MSRIPVLDKKTFTSAVKSSNTAKLIVAQLVKSEFHLLAALSCMLPRIGLNFLL